MTCVESKSKNLLSPSSFYSMEFHKNGIAYLDTFYLRRSVFFGEIFVTSTTEHKSKKVQFCSEFQGSWN